MIFTPNWPSKWKKTGTEKKTSIKFQNKGKGCKYKHFKIRKIDLFTTSK